MKKIGNYKSWIPEGLLDVIQSNDGDVVPVYQPDKWRGRPEWDRARIELEKAGYPDLNYKFHQYTIETDCIKKYMTEMILKDQSFVLKSPINPHWCENGHWWIVKYKPGDMQPMHFDPHIIDTKDCLRYTMMLSEYEDGHIFTYDDFLLTDYQIGDVFLWPDAMVLHGAANIGMTTRISLQMSFYNK
jgi:hypothetical protein